MWFVQGCAYDANGNQTGRTIAGVEYALTYDGENRLIEVVPVGGQLLSAPGEETATPTPTETLTATPEDGIETPVETLEDGLEEEPPAASETPAPATENPMETSEAAPTEEGSEATPVSSLFGKVAARLVQPGEVQLQEEDTPEPTASEIPAETPAPSEPGETSEATATQTPVETIEPVETLEETVEETPEPTASETPTPTLTAAPEGLPTGEPDQGLLLEVTPTEPTPEPLERAEYIYDGDNNLVKGIVNDTVTYYPGRHYNKEVHGEAVKVQKFYQAGVQTVAVRTLEGEQDTLHWVLADHLGSINVTANADGSWNSQIQYTAFGEIRANSGVTPSDYRYTGQLSQMDEIGLLFYLARWYDPYLNHWVQPDSIVPEATQRVQAWDRYAYTNNNAVNAIDPSGHCYKMVNGQLAPQCVNRWKEYSFKISIVSRSNWKALSPGADVKKVPNPPRNEGRYQGLPNDTGYKPYAEGDDYTTLDKILNTVVIHYEGDSSVMDVGFTDEAAVAQLQLIEMSNGYYDMPYHYIIGPDGTIYEGRNIGVRGAHVTADVGNTGKVGILWLGVSNSRGGIPTDAQFAATVNLVEFLDSSYGIDEVAGHGELERRVGGGTECPGLNALPYVEKLKQWR